MYPNQQGHSSYPYQQGWSQDARSNTPSDHSAMMTELQHLRRVSNNSIRAAERDQYAARIHWLESQLETTQVALIQAQKTIKNQSEALQGPRTGQRPQTTPRKPQGGLLPHSGGAVRRPPVWDPTGITQSTSVVHQTLALHSGHQYQVPQQSHPKQSGRALQQFGSAGQDDRQLLLRNDQLSHPAPSHRLQTSSTSAPTPPQNLPPQATPNLAHAFILALTRSPLMVDFDRVFTMSERYCLAHANVPSTGRDNSMTQAMKDRMMGLATRSSAFGLLSHGSTRYLIVSSLLNTWLQKEVFVYHAFQEYNRDMAERMRNTRKQIYASELQPETFHSIY